MGKLDEEILNFVRRNGPATPIDIAQKMGVNSIIITAVLVDAMSQNKIMRSKRKIGSSKYYFYPENLPTLQRKIADTLTPKEKEVLQKLLKESVLGEFELKPEEAAMLSNLEDLIGGFVVDYGGTPLRCWYSPDLQEAKAREIAAGKLQERFGAPKPATVQLRPQDQKIIEQLESLEQKKQVKVEVPAVKAKIEKLDKYTKKEEPKAEPKKKGTKKEEAVEADAETKEFTETVYQWLEKNNIDVTSEKTLKSGKEIELEAKVPMPFGKQTYIVRVLNTGKKPASQNDVSTIGMDAISRRIPVIIISASGFAKNAKKYWEKELQDLVFLMSRDDIE